MQIYTSGLRQQTPGIAFDRTWWLTWRVVLGFRSLGSEFVTPNIAPLCGNTNMLGGHCKLGDEKRAVWEAISAKEHCRGFLRVGVVFWSNKRAWGIAKVHLDNSKKFGLRSFPTSRRLVGCHKLSYHLLIVNLNI